MTYGDWRKPCEEHGRYEAHKVVTPGGTVVPGFDCPGGSPVSVSDLETFGITEWICSAPFSPRCGPESRLKVADWHSLCGWRVLAPIPDGEVVL